MLIDCTFVVLLIVKTKIMKNYQSLDLIFDLMNRG